MVSRPTKIYRYRSITEHVCPYNFGKGFPWLHTQSRQRFEIMNFFKNNWNSDHLNIFNFYSENIMPSSIGLIHGLTDDICNFWWTCWLEDPNWKWRFFVVFVVSFWILFCCLSIEEKWRMKIIQNFVKHITQPQKWVKEVHFAVIERIHFLRDEFHVKDESISKLYVNIVQNRDSQFHCLSLSFKNSTHLLYFWKKFFVCSIVEWLILFIVLKLNSNSHRTSTRKVHLHS